jgi:hypothetical protein
VPAKVHLENQLHALKRERSTDFAAVELRLQVWVNIAMHAPRIRVADGLGNSVRWRGAGQAKAQQGERKEQLTQPSGPGPRGVHRQLELPGAMRN